MNPIVESMADKESISKLAKQLVRLKETKNIFADLFVYASNLFRKK